MKKILAVVFVVAISLVFAFPSVAHATYDYGYITLDDTTTSRHFWDAGPSYDAHAWDAPVGQPMHDYWDLTIATSCDAIIEIEWFDWYPTNDVYELYIDGVCKGVNPAGQHGVWQGTLQTGGTYTIEVRWIYYQTNQPTISGGSYYDITFTVIAQICTIDIKPGSYPNSINPSENGLLPVAILGSTSFDVNNVNPETITLGGQGLASRGSVKAPKLAYSFEDVNLDGYTDVVCFFSVQELALTGTEEALTLEAQLFDGTSIQGTDSVRIVPP